MDNKKQLLKKLAVLQEKVRAIERKEWMAENASKVGTCWKYKNCFSCPEHESDYWWCYARVKKAVGISGHFEMQEFQCDKDGRLSCEYKQFGYLTGWVAITETEYLKEWELFKKKVLKVKP